MSYNSSGTIALQFGHGYVLAIIGWPLVAISTCFVVARSGVRRKLVKVDGSDVLLPVALILTLAHTALIQIAVDEGIDQSYESRDAHAIDVSYKVIYCTQILYILVLGLSKASMVFSTISVRPACRQLLGCHIANGLIFASTLACLLVSAFQCQLPLPWRALDGKCVDLKLFWTAAAAANIATDLLLIALLINVSFSAPVKNSTKWRIGGFCSLRLVVSAFAALQIYWLQVSKTSVDPPLDSFPYQSWTQIVLNASIITACVPSLGGFLCGLLATRVGAIDTELGNAPHRLWSSSCQKCSRKFLFKKSGNPTKIVEMGYTDRQPLAPAGPTDLTVAAKSRSRLSLFNWLKPGQTNSYVISNTREPDFSKHESPQLRSSYSQESLREIYLHPMVPPPAFTGEPRNWDGFEPPMEITPADEFRKDSLLPPFPGPPEKVDLPRGKWSMLISSANGPGDGHHRVLSTSSTLNGVRDSSWSSSTVCNGDSPPTGVLKHISNPSFVCSSAPVIPARSPARVRRSTGSMAHGPSYYPPPSFPLPSPPQRHNTVGDSRRRHSRKRSGRGSSEHTLLDQNARRQLNSSYSSHRSKVSNVSIRSEKFTVGEMCEDATAFERPRTLVHGNDGEFMDVDLGFDHRF